MAGVTILAACAHVSPRPDPAAALLQHAIDAAGGEAALTRARVLIWSGSATILAGDNKIELGVESRIEPFRSAQSITWLRDKGRATQRTLLIDGGEGWLVRDGKRSVMPAPMLRHERAQYAVYGLMRLVTLRQPGVVSKSLPADSHGRRGLHVQHPSAPEADMYFDANGRLAYLTDSVPDPEGDATVAQRFDFEGSIESDGVRWPRVMRISQNDKPYFELRLEHFRPEP